MHGIAVSILAENPERLAMLQQRIESTQAGHVVFAQASFPASMSDSAIRRIQDSHTEIVLLDIDPQVSGRAIQAIELIHTNVNGSVFAVGALNDSAVIVAAMRAGAREYLEHDATTESFSAGVKRVDSSCTKAHSP